MDIIAKIENRSGIENIEEICEACDGIMIGRGDMGVEIPLEELPAIQKYLITKCRLLGKRVITATEMLESMIYNARPTRAETSDVANAVYDGTSAVMLSGETAAGKYPVLTVATMAKIVEHTEKDISYDKRFLMYEFKIRNTPRCHITCDVWYGNRYRSKGYRRLHAIWDYGTHGISLSIPGGYCRNHYESKDMAQAGAFLGRNACHVSRIPIDGGSLLFRKNDCQRTDGS